MLMVSFHMHLLYCQQDRPQLGTTECENTAVHFNLISLIGTDTSLPQITGQL